MVGARKVGNRLVGGEVRADPEKAAVVQRLFALARAGIGTRSIASQLNKDGTPPIGRAKKWTESVVYNVLTSRATIGEFQPHTGRSGSKRKGRPETRKPTGEVVAGYYPPVVGRDEFEIVQAAIKGRASFRGRRGKNLNLFAGLLVDARTGRSLTYRHATGRPATIVPTQVPDDAPWTSFSGEVFERAVLSRLVELKPADVFPSDDLGGEVVRLGALHAAKEAELAGFRVEVESDTTLLKLFRDKLIALEREREELAGKLADAQRKAASPLAEAWGEFRGVADLLAANGSDDLRLRCRTALRRLVEKAHCVFAGDRRIQFAAIQVRFAGGAHRDYFIVYEQRRGNGKGYRRDARWWVKSFAEAGVADGLDLRRPDDAAAVVRVLDALDPGLYVLPAAGAGKST